MKFFTGLSVAALVSAASAVSLNLNKRDSPLDVKLEMVGNTEVKATVTNTGADNLKLYKAGSLLDTAAVEKVEIYNAGRRLPLASSSCKANTSQSPVSTSMVFASAPSPLA